MQKLSPELFCKTSYTWKFRSFHKKTPVLESLFNKIKGF